MLSAAWEPCGRGSAACKPSSSSDGVRSAAGNVARAPKRGRRSRLAPSRALPDGRVLDGLISDASTSLQNASPHFGTRAASETLQQARQLLPQLPSMQLPPLPSLPAVPQLVPTAVSSSSSSSVLQVRPMYADSPAGFDNGGGGGGGLGSAASAVADRVTGTASAALDGLRGAASSGASGASINDAATRVMLTPGSAWTDAAGQPLQPHFGTRAVLEALQPLLSGLVGEGGAAGFNGAGASAGGLDVGAALRGVLQSADGLSGDAVMTSLLAPLAGAMDGVAGGVASATGAVSDGVAALGGSWPTLQQALATAQTDGIGGYDLGTVALLSAGMLAAIAGSAPSAFGESPGTLIRPGSQQLPTQYTAQGVADYWEARPVAVAQRAAEVARVAASFGLALAADAAQGKVAENSPARASQLRQGIESLGPAYVKVAQALSTRVDLLNASYLMEIERLQDKVPVFETRLALEAMERAFGAPVANVAPVITASPVAAASLGQVYRATLSEQYGGGDVAVKVRRPGVLESVSLDLYLMRFLAQYLMTRPQAATNWVSLIDEWAVRFFDELDYTREAANAKLFKAQIEPLCEGIVVPDVIDPLCSAEVLTTAWIDGEKLSESNAGDVRELCNTLLNCYLIQLLDTGLLHADPHPGNLMRTRDGKIAILDYGLVTEVSPTQSVALTSYIAHLSVEDWSGVADDLVELGFIPDGIDPQQARIIEPLGIILEQLSQGGGAKGVNIDLVSVELNKLSKDYPIQVPAYFALILRAFSVIEGIALRVDPKYAIVSECFPYLTRRLVTDEHPRSKAALRTLLYGDKKHIDVQRLQRMVTGFSSFTVRGLQSAPDQAMLGSTAKDALRVVFSEKGTFLQEILVEELAASVDALSREAVSNLLASVMGSVPAAAAARAREALGPLRPVLLPLPTPLELISSMQPVVALNAEDQEALSTIRGLLALAQQMAVADDANGGGGLGPSEGLEPGDVGRALRELQPLLPELLPGVAHTGQLFVQALLRRVANRLANDLGPEYARGILGDAVLAAARAGLNNMMPQQGQQDGSRKP